MIRLNRSNLANLAGLVVVIYLAVILGETIDSNYHLQQQINGLNSQLSTLSIQNQTLSDNLQYYQSNSYKEKAAREDLGLQKPGESVIILTNPANVATSKQSKQSKAKPKSNLQQWVAFLTGKQ